MLLSVFEGVPQCDVSRDLITAGIPLIDFLSEITEIFPSKGEARRMLKDGGILLNKQKVSDENLLISAAHLLIGRYILVQKGKKNYYLVTAK